MTSLALIDVIGFWIGIFLTLSILSFLYKDNPFYKVAEHLFVGTSLGYLIITQYETVLKPKLVDTISHDLWKIVPLVLAAMMIVKMVSRRFAWLGRYPLAFVISLTAGLQMNVIAQSDLAVQMQYSATSLDKEKVDLNHASPKELGSLPGATGVVVYKWLEERKTRPFTSIDDAVTRDSLSASERAGLAEKRGDIVGLDARAATEGGHRDWFSSFSSILLLIGMMTSLLYFYFSIAHKGVIGRVSRVGVWTLMIGFGAAFGYTVQGRIALAIGRAQDVRGTFRDPADAAQIHGPAAAVLSALIIIAGLVVWERWNKRQVAAGTTK